MNIDQHECLPYLQSTTVSYDTGANGKTYAGCLKSSNTQISVNEERDGRKLDDEHSIQMEIAENEEYEIGKDSLKITEVIDGNIPIENAMEFEESSEVLTTDTIVAVEDCINGDIMTEDEDDDEKMSEQGSASCHQSKV